MEATTVLVIILATALAIFLVIAIFVAVQVYKLVTTIRTIADKAHNVSDIAEAIAVKLSRGATSTMVTAGLWRMARKVYQSKSKSGKKPE